MRREVRNRIERGTREGWVSPRVIRAEEDIVGGVRKRREGSQVRPLHPCIARSEGCAQEPRNNIDDSDAIRNASFEEMVLQRCLPGVPPLSPSLFLPTSLLAIFELAWQQASPLRSSIDSRSPSPRLIGVDRTAVSRAIEAEPPEAFPRISAA